jgi:1,4-alpha-glucan branching enzyme
VVLALGVVFAVYFAPFGQSPRTVTVHLTLEAPTARTVSVVGDWNQWNPDAHVMKDANEDGVWEIRLKLEPDQVYQYQFIINDERWIPDPESPVKVDDGFGGTNSVLDV